MSNKSVDHGPRTSLPAFERSTDHVLHTGPVHRLLTCRAGHRTARRHIQQGRTSKPLRCVAEECSAPVFRTCIRAAHLALGVRSGPPVGLQDGWPRVCGRGPPTCLKTSPSSVNSVRRQVTTHGCVLCKAAAPGCAVHAPFQRGCTLTSDLRITGNEPSGLRTTGRQRRIIGRLAFLTATGGCGYFARSVRAVLA